MTVPGNHGPVSGADAEGETGYTLDDETEADAWTEAAAEIGAWVREKPIVLARLDASKTEALGRRFSGLSRLSLVVPSDDVTDLKLPTICLVEFDTFDGEKRCRIGVVRSKQVVGTIQTRVLFRSMLEVDLPSLAELDAAFDDSRQRKLYVAARKRSEEVSSLSPVLSERLVGILFGYFPDTFLSLAKILPGLRPKSEPEWQRDDAIKIALAVFGLDERTAEWQANATDVGYVYEDHLIAADAHSLPGFEVVERSVSGVTRYRKDNQVLEVIIANRGPIERMLGVDLVYVNHTQGNMVLVQYKMLERQQVTKQSGKAISEWIFRPDDQFSEERARMVLPVCEADEGEFRLNREPFFFKFARRESDKAAGSAIIVANTHLDRLLADPRIRGPRGGVRLNFESLEGRYLRQSDLVSLIRSGYIGCYRKETEALRVILHRAMQGNRAVVLAWQTHIHERQPKPAAPPHPTA